MSEEFRSKIIAFLKESNPNFTTEEIENKIDGFWSLYKQHKTPEFDEWLSKTDKHEKLIALRTSLQDKTNWLNIAWAITKEFPIYYDRNNIWWTYNNNRQCWEITDETDIANIVDEVARQNTLKGGIKSEMIEAFRRVGRKSKPEAIPKSWIQFADKIVDLENGNEIEPSPKYFLTNPVPHNLGNTDETPVIDSILSSWGGEYALTLKQIMAYCILKDYPIHRIFLLIGSGSNGKGTFLRLLNRFIGQDNVASVEMDLIVTNQFHITKLHNKLCCQMSETNFSALKNTSMLKKLSGGDLIGFEYKNKLPFDDYNYAKIVIATNSLPVTHDKTDGFYRRWVIVDFKNQFNEKTDILSQITEEELENLARWSVGCLKELLTKREFHNEGTIQDRKTKYEEKSNPLTTFINDFYKKDVNEKIPASHFFDHFTSFLQQRGMRTLTYQAVREMMKEEGYEYGRDRFPDLGMHNAVASVIGLKRSDNIKESVSDVSTVSAVSVLPPTRGTKGNVVTQLTQLTQNSEEKSTLTRFRAFFTGNYSGQAIPVEILKAHLDFVSDEWLDLHSRLGDIYQKSPGWYALM